MTWLLGEIAVSLLLAGIAGWYIGWAVRGFREGDRVEDLRRTLRATEEVKDRELAEANRRADKAAERNERLQRENERLVERIEARADRASGPRSIRVAEGTEDEGRPGDDLAMVATLPAEPESPTPEAEQASARTESASVALRLEERLAEAQAQAQDRERALRDKTAAVLALQAELARLRQAAEERASEMARLEQRLVELEPLQERLGQEDGAVAEAQASVRALENERDEALGRVTDLEREMKRLHDEIDRRDVRINDLRVRFQNTAAELEELRARSAADAAASGAAPEPGVGTTEGLAETRQLLQRQIERNRKQDAVHRQVVSSLQEQLAELQGRLRDAASARGTGVDDARWQQLLAERDSRILGLRNRVVELEEADRTSPSPPDDLRKIYGIGPKLARRLEELGVRTFAQIAAWDEAEIERITAEIGDQTGRIRRDDWVRSARALLRERD